MFNWKDEKIKEFKGTGGKPFPIDVAVPDVTLKNIEYVSGKDSKGVFWEGIDFTFVTTNSKEEELELRDRMFTIDEDRIKSFNPDDPDKAVAKAYFDQTQRLYHIAEEFGISYEDLVSELGEITEYKTMMQAYAKMVLAKTGDTKVFLKTMPNKAGYATLPLYPKFIEKMKKGEDSTLVYSQWEKGKVNASVAPKDIIEELDDIDVEDVSTDEQDDLSHLEELF